MPRQRRFQPEHTPEESTSEDTPSPDVITAKLIDLEHRVNQLEQAAEEAAPVDPLSTFKLAALENRVRHIEQFLQSDLPRQELPQAQVSRQTHMPMPQERQVSDSHKAPDTQDTYEPQGFWDTLGASLRAQYGLKEKYTFTEALKEIWRLSGEMAKKK